MTETDDRSVQPGGCYSFFKWLVLLLLVGAFAYLLITRALSMLPASVNGLSDLLPNSDTAATETTPEATEESGDSDDNNDTASEPTAEPTDEPETVITWENAAVDTVNEELVLSGTAEPDTTVNVLLNDEEIGTVTADADGGWELVTPLREPGDYDVRVQLLDDDGETVLGESINKLEIPESAVAVEPEPTTVPVEQEDPVAEDDENSEKAEETAAGTDEESDTQTAITTDVDLDTFTGGIVTLSGNSTPDSDVEVVITAGEEEAVNVVTTDDAGDWSLQTVIVDPADYAVAVQEVGESAEPSLTFTLDDTVTYATKGNCLSGIPPFGTIRGDQYIVAPCEYFTLIAERLGVGFFELKHANPQIRNVEHLYPTQPINIP